MSAKYICPAQIRKNTHPFLMCELLKQENTDYNLRDNASKIACVCQHYCPNTKRAENTAEYRECYEKMIEQNAEEHANALMKAQSTIIEKPKRKTAKTDNEL